MPRQSRLDTPGALHHIIARGNERRRIFEDKKDRNEFLIRLGDIFSGTGTICYAWAIIPNHFYLFLRTGTFPIAIIMRRLLTGYVLRWFGKGIKQARSVYHNYIEEGVSMVNGPSLQEEDWFEALRDVQSYGDAQGKSVCQRR
ncbi:MAG: transposase [Deltaproteobacteria bacterium]|nr:transposase [Deltaproteobacteria bacterium]